MTPPFEAFFLPVGDGQRLCLYHPPRAPLRANVLYVHPFAEEMNKSRRMAAQQSRALAKAGCAVLQIDLLGCGDSSGDFGAAIWSDWLQDVQLAIDWMQARQPATQVLWGLRAGCLLLAQAAARMPAGIHYVFWQPTVSGNLTLQQFLRLKMAGQLESNGAKGVTEGLRRQLQSGQAVEVAGYSIHPALAQGLQLATLMPPSSGNGSRLAWLEVSSREPLALLPASAAPLAAWAQAGCGVHAEAVPGPAFWQTAEIQTAPSLLRATTEAVERMLAP